MVSENTDGIRLTKMQVNRSKTCKWTPKRRKISRVSTDLISIMLLGPFGFQWTGFREQNKCMCNDYRESRHRFTSRSLLSIPMPWTIAYTGTSDVSEFWVWIGALFNTSDSTWLYLLILLFCHSCNCILYTHNIQSILYWFTYIDSMFFNNQSLNNIEYLVCIMQIFKAHIWYMYTSTYCGNNYCCKI